MTGVEIFSLFLFLLPPPPTHLVKDVMIKWKWKSNNRKLSVKGDLISLLLWTFIMMYGFSPVFPQDSLIMENTWMPSSTFFSFLKMNEFENCCWFILCSSIWSAANWSSLTVPLVQTTGKSAGIYDHDSDSCVQVQLTSGHAHGVLFHHSTNLWHQHHWQNFSTESSVPKWSTHSNVAVKTTAYWRGRGGIVISFSGYLCSS